MFGLFILFLTICNCALAQNNSFNYSENPSFIISSYQGNIITQSRESISIGYYISGIGDIDGALIGFSFPGEIIEGGLKVKILANFTHYENNSEYIIPIYDSFDLSTRGQIELLSDDVLFQYIPEKNTLYANTESRSENGTIYSAPIIVNFKISNNAKPGDYETVFILYYKHDGQLYRETKSINVHVKYWYEKDWVQWIVIGAAFLAILSVYVHVGKWVFNKIGQTKTQQKGYRQKK